MKKLFLLPVTLFGAYLLCTSFLTPQGEQHWRFITGGRVRSAPAVGQNGVIYVIAEDRYLYALNPDGKRLWRLYLEKRVSDCFSVGYDGSIYVGLKTGIILAINPYGKTIWQFDTKAEIKYAPALFRDGTVLFTTQNGDLFALSHTGLLRWKKSLSLPPADSPVTDVDGTIYVPLAGAELLALYPWGETKWRLSLIGEPDSPAISANGTVLVGTDAGLLYAVDTDGTVFWRALFDSPVLYSVLDKSGNIYGTLADGRVFCISPEGKILWSVRLGKRISRSPALGQSGTIYVATDNNFLYALSPGGAVLWSLPVKGELTHPVLSPQGMLYAGSSDWLVYAFQAEKSQQSAWPLYGHDSLHSGSSSRKKQSYDINKQYAGNPDFLYFKNLLLSNNPHLIEKGLTAAEERYRHSTIYSAKEYLFYLLGLVAGKNIVEYEKGFHYPTAGYSKIRERACRLYTLIGGFYSRNLLLRIMRDDRDISMKTTAVHCLGMLQSDPRGAAVRIMASLVFSAGRNTPNNSLAREVIRAMGSIARYQGALPREGIKALLAITGGNYLDNVKQQAVYTLEKLQ